MSDRDRWGWWVSQYDGLRHGFLPPTHEGQSYRQAVCGHTVPLDKIDQSPYVPGDQTEWHFACQLAAGSQLASEGKDPGFGRVQ